jgi:ABC-type hemin transport system ATPase subunit
MKLTDYPLYLDELGSSFDETHQYKLVPLIKELADDPRFSQVLIISHALVNQTAFPSSQTIILDNRNLEYNHPYNEHVEFA